MCLDSPNICQRLILDTNKSEARIIKIAIASNPRKPKGDLEGDREEYTILI